jgi:tRNA1(Val) A37 N6-methylase TrmN6
MEGITQGQDGVRSLVDEANAKIFWGDTVSLDALSGAWRIYQFKEGHRFSTDDVITASYAADHVPRAPRRILDLGTGIGSVAMMCAWRWRDAQVVGIEAQAWSANLAKNSIEYNGITDRVDIRHGDFRVAGALSEDARFDLVTCSPPYIPLGSGTVSGRLQRAYCRFEIRGGVEEYLAVAASVLTEDGNVSLIFDARGLDRVERAARAAGLRIRHWRRVVSRQGRDPLLVAFILAPTREHWELGAPEEDLVVRDEDDERTDEMARIRASVGMPPMPGDPQHDSPSKRQT